MGGKWYRWAHRRQASSAETITTKKANGPTGSPESLLEEADSRPARTSESLPSTSQQPTKTSDDSSTRSTPRRITLNRRPPLSDGPAVTSSRSNERPARNRNSPERPTRVPRPTMADIWEGVSRGRQPPMVRITTQSSPQPTPTIAPPRNASHHSLTTSSILGIVFGVAMVLLILSALVVIGKQRLRSNSRWMRMDADEVDVERGEKGVSEEEACVSAGQNVHIPPSPLPSKPLEARERLETPDSPPFPRARQVTFLLPPSRESRKSQEKDAQAQIESKPPPLPPKT